jgi:hypothetical protein
VLKSSCGGKNMALKAISRIAAWSVDEIFSGVDRL